jgi:AP-3 complex subunit beta
VKLQVVNFAVKLHLARPSSSPSPLSDDDHVAKLVRYVLELARFDADYDVRDRTRLMTASLGLAAGGGQGEQQVRPL